MKVYRHILDEIAGELVKEYSALYATYGKYCDKPHALSYAASGRCNGEYGLYVISKTSAPLNPDWYKDVNALTDDIAVEFYGSYIYNAISTISLYYPRVYAIQIVKDGIVHHAHGIYGTKDHLIRTGLNSYDVAKYLDDEEEYEPDDVVRTVYTHPEGTHGILLKDRESPKSFGVRSVLRDLEAMIMAKGFEETESTYWGELLFEHKDGWKIVVHLCINPNDTLEEDDMPIGIEASNGDVDPSYFMEHFEHSPHILSVRMLQGSMKHKDSMDVRYYTPYFKFYLKMKHED